MSDTSSGGRCGLTRFELDSHHWVTEEGRCKALCEDETKCGEPYSKHISAAAPAAGSGRKRKSLPAPISGSGWTRDLLPKLDIHILHADEKTVLRTGGMPAEMKLQVSDNAQSVISSCSFIDMNSLMSLSLSPPRANPGFALYKYLRLIAGESKFALESVVDDLVIHLLTALGFNDDYFMVLSKNNLKFSMHGENNVTATADVTVYDINSKFRLAVIEDKVEPDKLREDKDTQDTEAQLVAEAIAAAQSNLDVQEEQRKRRRTVSEGHVSDQTCDDSLPVSSGPLFLMRVLGQRFSFYSTHLSTSFLKFMRDYEDQDKQEMQIVYQLTRPIATTVSSTPTPTPASTSTHTSTATATAMREQVHFLFAVPTDREYIIHILDYMLQILRMSATHLSSNSQPGVSVHND